MQTYLNPDQSESAQQLTKMSRRQLTKAIKNKIFFNGRKTEIAPVTGALQAITDELLEIRIDSELPLGSGFGISGASTLATLFAANKLLRLNKKAADLVNIAHIAEIREKTGLGTIATQSTGGFLIKEAAGIPPVFKRLPFEGQKIYATLIGEIKTEKVLRDKILIDRINKEADKAFKQLYGKRKLGLKDILDISFSFSTQSNLLKSNKVKKLISDIRKKGGFATMAILGNTVLSDIKPVGVKYPVFTLTISNQTAGQQNEN